MAYYILLCFCLAITWVRAEEKPVEMTRVERLHLREEARKMFYHGYNAYMENAYPADELMPLSCKGRWKGITPSRGDMDDALGNFSLTLVDSLDTLVIMGDFREFNRAIKLVIQDVTFDHDIVVSVFESNIRVLGGLLSAHVLANKFKTDLEILHWYNGELLKMANDLGTRLLPAFNSSTGIPHGRINLRHGLKGLTDQQETCTACAGTMILEMAALSRLTGNPVFEQKAHKAMDRLWTIRHRTSDLMGTIINIESGDWVRKDSGVGAGIDSYYEYCLKAYILLGDEKYLVRFNRHYNAVMKYISRGPLLLDVHMHRPHTQSRNFMDALLAFWPGLQVLLGDVKPAVETHEMLYQVMQRHIFIPEAFSFDLQVIWGQHPLRPEFLESTYFLHRATGDDHYLFVGKAVLEALQQYARVPCGYAAVNDVRTKVHEDRMDSFVLAETFKYLYMLFGYSNDLPINLDEYVLTTEAHFLPLSLANLGRNNTSLFLSLNEQDEHKLRKTCPNNAALIAEKVRQPMRELLGAASSKPPPNLRPLTDPRQLLALADMGISVITLADGKVQLLYTTSSAKTSKEAADGLAFMREMSRRNQLNDFDNGVIPVGVRVNDIIIPGGPGRFGKVIIKNERYIDKMAFTQPEDACSTITNMDEVKGKFGIAKRGQCTFVQKATNMRAAGIPLAIIIDNVPASSHKNSPFFAMAGDGQEDVDIPAVFLYSEDAQPLLNAIKKDPSQVVVIGDLRSLKREYEEGCKFGVCENEPIIPADEIDAANKESIEHLKTVLQQLAAQFELSLSNDENAATQRNLHESNRIIISEKDGVKKLEESYIENSHHIPAIEDEEIQWHGIVKTNTGFKADVPTKDKTKKSGEL